MGIRLSPNNPKNNSWRDDYPMTYLTSFSDDRTKARKEQMTDISSMTDEQLNEALAKWQGWHDDWDEEMGCNVWVSDETEEIVIRRNDWQPCTDLNQAVECAEKFDWWAILKVDNDSEKFDYHATVSSDWYVADEYGSTPARALCEAVLMAKRGEG